MTKKQMKAKKEFIVFFPAFQLFKLFVLAKLLLSWLAQIYELVTFNITPQKNIICQK